MPLFGVDGNIAVATESNDIFTLVGNNETVDLLGGNDLLTVKGSGNTVNGNAGNDELIDDGSGTGNTLDGRAGNDIIFGGTQGTLAGGTGRDVIYASPNGSGGNTITGGAGRDIFIIATGEIPATPNTITDFNATIDYLVLSLAPDVTLFNQLAITQDGGNTIISFDDTNDNVANPKPIAILQGVTPTSVTQANLIVLQNGAPLPSLPNTAPVVTTGPDFQYDTTPTVGQQVGTFQFSDVDEDELIISITGNNSNLFTFEFNPNDALDGSGTGIIKIAEGANLDLFTPTARFTLTISVNDGIANPVSDSIDIFGVEAPSAFKLDIDGNGTSDGLTDGIMAIRYLFSDGGLTQQDIEGVFDSTGERGNLAAINAYLGANLDALDIDGNGTSDGLTDGIMAIRYLFSDGGLTQQDIEGVFDPTGERGNLAAINAYLADLIV